MSLAAMVVPQQPQPQPQPQPLLPSVDPRQLAIQQQNFINQQALILVRVGRALRLPSGDRSVGQSQPGSYRAHRPLPLQAQQMTAQAMTLSLEQQTHQRQRQAEPRTPRAAAPTSPPAVAPKPKKPLVPREEPEQELESVGAYLRARSQGQAGGTAWGGESGLWG